MTSWRKSAGPTTGRLARTGTGRGASPSTVRPTKGRPKRSVRPVARNTSARPDTTWFARRVTLDTAWTRARSPLAAAAATRPPKRLPEATVTAKPVSAPTSMSPSSPRLSTPARSATISPSAGRRSAVPARTAAVTMEVRRAVSTPAPGSPLRLHRRPRSDLDRRLERRASGGDGGRWSPRHPIPGEEIAGEEGEQEQALEHEHHRDRELAHDLEHLAPGEEPTQEHGGEPDADRVEAAEPGDDDRRVAVARGEHGDQPVLEPRHLDQAGQAGQPAADRDHGERGAGHVEPGVAGGGGVAPDDARREAETAPLLDEVDQRERRQRQHQSRVDPEVTEARQARRGRDDRGHGEVGGGRVLPRPVDEVADQGDRDVAEEEARDDLVDLAAQLEEGGHEPPRGSGEEGHQHHARQAQPGRLDRQRPGGGRGGRCGAQVELEIGRASCRER